MKVPKTMKRHCPKCKTHTEHKVSQNKARGRSSAHPISRGSTKRIKARGERRGHGNLGRYSRPPKPKMVGKKLTKKTDFRYTCSKCNRTFVQKEGTRAKKIELI
ncbi:MAG: 50S ribosomal protein L44e [Candidatus Woesearchaeota archaeon]|nr:50S ribosomal protein L44e [Candidatus Woesearchaeota archaeon]